MYKLAARQIDWGSNLAHRVVRPIFKQIHIRRTIRSEVTLPDGTRTYPAEGLLPATICVEELSFNTSSPVAKSVFIDGNRAAKRLFARETGEAAPSATQNTSSQAVAGTASENQLNFGVHRKGVLVAFDHRNKKILEGKAVFTGAKNKVTRKLKRLLDARNGTTAAQVRRRRKASGKASQPVVGIAHVEDLVHNDTNGGLSYYYEQGKLDPAIIAPADRASMVRWVAHENPILTRALALAYQYVRV